MFGHCSSLTFKKFAASKRRAQGDTSFVKYLLQWAQEERTILLEVYSSKAEAARKAIALLIEIHTSKAEAAREVRCCELPKFPT
ncbi:hypothetical protein H6F98_23115 [Microcoleus sp. FACHB-SPT15]|uniref:hypothetical protein n=1 Tax=Microcoleus sp. FACHB-SPT15 TaxID=2692830 RepID=UPI00177CB016|nr:hypothetical protein [Microcoleus sp. FACHB-SPT15]MBD1808321.1 hypothetical protein [Microcoleus sp. FACHB-SPT15]